MALPSSGQLTFSAIATELGIAGYSYIGVDLRDMSSDAGFSTPDAISEFYGYSNVYTETQTVTVGTFYDADAYAPSTSYGYATVFSIGSVSDGTFNAKGGEDIKNLYWNNFNIVTFSIHDDSNTNADWSQMVVGGQTFTRASASFLQDSATNVAQWQWAGITANPFGTTVNATKAVVFT
jgi:hypothetical protein